MLIAFQGGDVHAEIFRSALHFKARDLLALLNIGIGRGGVFKSIDTRILFTYNTSIENVGRYPTRYIHVRDVTNFLDNVHVITKMKTIVLMQEFLSQFNKYIK